MRLLSGSLSMKSSNKLRNVLEIILAFGNYLNSSKQGPAYGFKLQSLDTLLDTKSTDKRMSLLHYIVFTIRQNFPELMNFDTELLYIDNAAQGSRYNLQRARRGATAAQNQLHRVRGEVPHRRRLRSFRRVQRRHSVILPQQAVPHPWLRNIGK